MVPNGKTSDQGATNKPRRCRKTRTGSSSDEFHTEVTGMLVGEDYQADIPKLLTEDEKLADKRSAGLRVWSPISEAYDTKIDDYVAEATARFGYNADQALGMLNWHKNDFEKATADLSQYQPTVEKWSAEDKAIFEQAFLIHGKNFRLIARYFPEKKIFKLVEFFYTWKKTRSLTSVMDEFVQMEEDSDVLRGMNLDREDLHLFASGKGDPILKQFDSELVALKRQVQKGKQGASAIKRNMANGIEDYRVAQVVTRAHWTNEEQLLAVEGVRQFGKDFKVIAEVIGNKTEAHVRSFFSNCRRKYNLDAVLREFEEESGHKQKKGRGESSSAPLEVNGIGRGLTTLRQMTIPEQILSLISPNVFPSY